MGLKICEECGEETDEAKAFCPDCGNAFVEEEKREGSSEFDDYAGTVNFSKSVYKMMLTEMDLDTSQKSDGEKQTTTKADSTKIEPSVIEPIKEDKQAKIDLPKKSSIENSPAVQDEKSGINKSIIMAVVGGLILLLFALVVLLIVLYFYFS